MGLKAGIGEHHVYRIVPDNLDNEPLTKQSHYVGVDAVSWYINKESSWFTKRMASGTLDITLSNGMEKYQTALGTFELNGGSKTAPVFDRPVLLDRNYRGGSIGFNASLTAIKKDTVLASVLKSSANASLGIVAGMVDTAAIAGPTQLLTAAGGQLVKGVRDILSDQSDKHEPLFDFNGLEFNISPDKIIGPETYLLFHRGEDLEEDNLEIQVDGQITRPVYNGQNLEDGAWLLLRVKRSSEYPNIRPWFSTRRNLNSKIKSLVDNVVNGFQSKETALKQFEFTDSDDGTLLDQFGRLRSIIFNDGVITEVQALTFVTQITNKIVAARKAIKEIDKSYILASEKAMDELLIEGKISTSLDSIIQNEIISINNIRRPFLINDEESFSLTSERLNKELKNMPITIKELQNK